LAITIHIATLGSLPNFSDIGSLTKSPLLGRARTNSLAAGCTSSLADQQNKSSGSYQQGNRLTERTQLKLNMAIISSHSSTVIMINSIHSLLV